MNRDKKSEAFRELLRIIGRGKKLQRDLTTAEAYEAIRLMLGDTISDAQIGGFLVTMRVKEETADECDDDEEDRANEPLAQFV